MEELMTSLKAGADAPAPMIAVQKATTALNISVNSAASLKVAAGAWMAVKDVDKLEEKFFTTEQHQKTLFNSIV